MRKFSEWLMFVISMVVIIIIIRLIATTITTVRSYQYHQWWLGVEQAGWCWRNDAEQKQYLLFKRDF
jgi:hypothetical protein